MPYVVRRTDGNVQLILSEGLVNTDLGLTLVGRSRTDYGESIAENFVRILENFASTTAPANPLDGQIWFDKSAGKYKFWNNNTWTILADRGFTGYAGSVGATGIQGIEGPIGYAGSQGNRGYTGSQGNQGATGPSGPASDVLGPIGYTGSQGATGPISNAPGPKGYTGSRGIMGPQGPSGYVGSKGLIGELGPQGDRGYTGYTGSVGATGPGLTGNLSFDAQTISGTNPNQDINFNPLGTGSLKVNSGLLPTIDNTYNLGSVALKFATLYTNSIVFGDGSSTITSNRIIGVSVPVSSKGSVGDVTGLFAIDNNYFYRCMGNYDGTTDIWKRVAWDGSTW